MLLIGARIPRLARILEWVNGNTTSGRFDVSGAAGLQRRAGLSLPAQVAHHTGSAGRGRRLPRRCAPRREHDPGVVVADLAALRIEVGACGSDLVLKRGTVRRAREASDRVTAHRLTKFSEAMAATRIHADPPLAGGPTGACAPLVAARVRACGAARGGRAGEG